MSTREIFGLMTKTDKPTVYHSVRVWAPVYQFCRLSPLFLLGERDQLIERERARARTIQAENERASEPCARMRDHRASDHRSPVVVDVEWHVPKRPARHGSRARLSAAQGERLGFSHYSHIHTHRIHRIAVLGSHTNDRLAVCGGRLRSGGERCDHTRMHARSRVYVYMCVCVWCIFVTLRFGVLRGRTARDCERVNDDECVYAGMLPVRS